MFSVYMKGIENHYSSMALADIAQCTKCSIGTDLLSRRKNSYLALILAQFEETGTRSSDEILENDNEHLADSVGTCC